MDGLLTLAIDNLSSPLILSVVLGVGAALARSDLTFQEAAAPLSFAPVSGQRGTLPLHERGSKWGDSDGSRRTIIRRRALSGFMRLERRRGASRVRWGSAGAQLKTWRLEIKAFGLVEAKRRQQADAAELVRLRKENKRLAEEVEILD